MRSALAFFLILYSFTTFAEAPLKRIAFGSCNNQNDSQPLWKDIVAQNPDLWIWGGDNIYADWGKTEDIARAYEKQNNIEDYKILKSKVPMIGTWDDHDYGLNDAGGTLAFKKISQSLHHDFLGVPKDSPRRNQEGIYYTHNYGQGDQKIKIIILDNRYFKGLETDAPILGKKQWEWLENELKNSDANLHFFVAGLSVFSPTLPYTEEWWHSPVEVNRMIDLMKKHQVKAPVFLTGDKHFSSIFKYWGHLEFMSSGMTHTAPRRTWWYLSRKYPTTYFGISYGIIDIAWEGTTPKLTMFMRDGKRDIHKKNVIWKNNTWNFL